MTKKLRTGMRDRNARAFEIVYMCAVRRGGCPRWNETERRKIALANGITAKSLERAMKEYKAIQAQAQASARWRDDMVDLFIRNTDPLLR